MIVESDITGVYVRNKTKAELRYELGLINTEKRNMLNKRINELYNELSNNGKIKIDILHVSTKNHDRVFTCCYCEKKFKLGNGDIMFTTHSCNPVKYYCLECGRVHNRV